MLDKNKKVWMCLVCKNYKIADKDVKPTTCPCSNPNFVIVSNLVVTK